ncbi:hypothetical protein ACEZ3G_07485 [Maribacter algicola]|uniref:Uncharacterized protein n=1 Tax=Meishania litoralis TaxID=3434685 RepID=A0ACC7LP24_9FLAO
MDGQDNKFNYKIILAALVAVIIGILIAFYYSYAQSTTQISFLEQEKELLVKDLTLMRGELDRLEVRNEVSEIDLQTSKNRVQQLLDSVGKLNFTIEKLREFKGELRRLEAINDSLKLKNNFLKYNNIVLTEKYEEARKRAEELRLKNESIAENEAAQRELRKELDNELKTKTYLELNAPLANGMRLRSGKPIITNKASSIEKLRGCVTIVADPSIANEQRIIYLQFLDPEKRIIEDNANTISVSGNIYSKRVEIITTGDDIEVCDFITIPEGSLKSGNYTLNIFENERLLSSTGFDLK